MIVWWNGWGPLAIVILMPLLLACGLSEIDSFAFVTTAGVFLFFAGFICVYYGTQWNRAGNTHTLYSVPLQAWGWIYLVFVWLFCAIAIFRSISITFFPSRLDPANLSVALEFSLGLAGILIVSGAAYYLRKVSKQASAPTIAPKPQVLDGLSRPETLRENQRQ